MPFKDELASSWICRTARRYRETPPGLTALLWRSCPVWNRDLDRWLGFADLALLAERMGVDSDLARATSLRPYAARLRNFGAGLTPGITRLGIFHRTRRLHGQQYCPDCLAEDPQPYFRRTWRLAFVFACPAHGTLLRDACPHCEAPVVFHRARSGELTRCHVCQGDLRVKAAPVTEHALSCQAAILEAWENNTVALAGRRISFNSWLAGARLLFHPLQNLTQREFHRSLPLEVARVEIRARLLSATWWLTGEWPDRMIAALVASRFTASQVFDAKRAPAPRWLASAVHASLGYRPRGCRQSFWPATEQDADIGLEDLVAHRLDGMPAAGVRP